MPLFQRYAPFAFLALAVFAVYANIYDNALLFDDDLLIHQNDFLRSWGTLGKLLLGSTTGGAHIAGGFYRPIQSLLYFILFQINGEVPFLYHLLNVSLHATNACLGYRLALRLGLDPRAAMIGILIWALHPAHVEAVTYMSGTADPLFVMFCLWALNILMPTTTLSKTYVCLPLFALALLSKETAVVFPGLVCVCMYFLNNRSLKPKDYVATWPLWVITILYLAWRMTTTDFDGPARYDELDRLNGTSGFAFYAKSPDVRFLTFLATLPAYLGILLWPVDLHMERLFNLFTELTDLPVLWGVSILLIAIANVVWNKNPSARPFNWGLLWFGAAHFPNTGIFFAGNAILLEHWMYLPTLGLFLGIAQSGKEVLDKVKDHAVHTTVAVLSFGVIAALSARTFDQNRMWHDPIGFYTRMFSYGVLSPRGHNNLAIAYINDGQIEKGIAEYRYAIKEGDAYAETHFNLALGLLKLPNQRDYLPEVIEELQKSIEIEPRFYRAYQAMSEILAQTGQPEKAAQYKQKADELLGR